MSSKDAGWAEQSLMSYTIAHFCEIARQNRFAENNKIEHDHERCLVCRPEMVSADPFEIYLGVIAESVKVRRPVLDVGLIEEINRDIEMSGDGEPVTIESLLSEAPDAKEHWRNWVREALATGLGLLSIHSPTSLDLDLGEAAGQGYLDLIEQTVEDLIRTQSSDPGAIGNR